MSNARRKLLKSLAIGGSTATFAQLPTVWSKPIVESVVLPAHAQTTAPDLPNIVNAGTVQATSPITGLNAPDIIDTLVQPAYAQPAVMTYQFSVCIVLDRAAETYDAFVIVRDGGSFPSYRGTGLPADPEFETDSNLDYDGDCLIEISFVDQFVPPAHANGLGVSIRVYGVSNNGANVEVEIDSSRWTGFLEWNDFGCGLDCSELEAPIAYDSDRNIKEGFSAVDEQEILEKVAAMPVEYWNYTDRDPGVRHIGPMAQDFHAAFNLGVSDRRIDAVDANGVNLASIKALYRRLEEKDARIDALESELRKIKQALGI